MRRIRITLAYDGAGRFTDGRCNRGCRPSRELWNRSSPEIEGKPVQVAGSGRTDAGVHALAQVAAFTHRQSDSSRQPATRRESAAAADGPHSCGRRGSRKLPSAIRRQRERLTNTASAAEKSVALLSGRTSTTIPIRWRRSAWPRWLGRSKGSTISRRLPHRTTGMRKAARKCGRSIPRCWRRRRAA